MNLTGLVRRFVNRGVRDGIRSYSRGGKDFAEMSREERDQANATNRQMQQGRRILNLARRFMR